MKLDTRSFFFCRFPRNMNISSAELFSDNCGLLQNKWDSQICVIYGEGNYLLKHIHTVYQLRVDRFNWLGSWGVGYSGMCSFQSCRVGIAARG